MSTNKRLVQSVVHTYHKVVK